MPETEGPFLPGSLYASSAFLFHGIKARTSCRFAPYCISVFLLFTLGALWYYGQRGKRDGHAETRPQKSNTRLDLDPEDNADQN